MFAELEPAHWIKKSKDRFTEIYNKEMGNSSDFSLLTEDFKEPEFDMNNPNLIRSQMYNGLLKVDDKVFGSGVRTPTARFSEPNLTTEQKIFVAEGQYLASKNNSTLPILESIWPFIFDYTPTEIEELTRIRRGEENLEPTTKIETEFTEEDDKVLLDAANKMRSVFRRPPAFRAGSDQVRIYRGRRFFQGDLPDMIIRLEAILSTVPKEFKQVASLLPMNFKIMRTLDARLAIYVSTIVEKYRQAESEFFAPALRVASMIKMEDSLFSVIVNDAWTRNLASWIESQPEENWGMVMDVIEQNVKSQLVDKSIHELNSKLLVQHGDLKADNVLVLELETLKGIEYKFGLIDFGISSLYKLYEKGRRTKNLIYKREYNNTLFSGNTGIFLDPWLDASYLQYSIRFHVLNRFGRKEFAWTDEFYDRFKDWFPLGVPMMDYKWRQEKYAALVWVYNDERLTEQMLENLGILSKSSYRYLDIELELTINHIARQQLGYEPSEESEDQDDILPTRRLHGDISESEISKRRQKIKEEKWDSRNESHYYF